MLRSSDWPYSGDDPPELRTRYIATAVVFVVVWITAAVRLVCLALGLF
jgi:hypothetical protein